METAMIRHRPHGRAAAVIGIVGIVIVAEIAATQVRSQVI
jgi:hypothetical protein